MRSLGCTFWGTWMSHSHPQGTEPGPQSCCWPNRGPAPPSSSPAPAQFFTGCLFLPAYVLPVKVEMEMVIQQYEKAKVTQDEQLERLTQICQEQGVMHCHSQFCSHVQTLLGTPQCLSPCRNSGAHGWACGEPKARKENTSRSHWCSAQPGLDSTLTSRPGSLSLYHGDPSAPQPELPSYQLNSQSILRGTVPQGRH